MIEPQKVYPAFWKSIINGAAFLNWDPLNNLAP